MYCYSRRFQILGVIILVASLVTFMVPGWVWTIPLSYPIGGVILGAVIIISTGAIWTVRKEVGIFPEIRFFPSLQGRENLLQLQRSINRRLADLDRRVCLLFDEQHALREDASNAQSPEDIRRTRKTLRRFGRRISRRKRLFYSLLNAANALGFATFDGINTYYVSSQSSTRVQDVIDHFLDPLGEGYIVGRRVPHGDRWLWLEEQREKTPDAADSFWDL